MQPRPNPPTPSVFVDTSVFFAAAYSVNGSAHDLMMAAFTGQLLLVFSVYVLDETERNLRLSAPRSVNAFLRLRDSLPYRVSTPSPALVYDTARIIVAKDAPIIAAARAAGVEHVATYDRKDLLSKRAEIELEFGITVAPPDEVLRLFAINSIHRDPFEGQ